MMRVTSSDERRAESWAVSGSTKQDARPGDARVGDASDKPGGVQGSGPGGDMDGAPSGNPGGGNSLARYLGRHICR